LLSDPKENLGQAVPAACLFFQSQRGRESLTVRAFAPFVLLLVANGNPETRPAFNYGTDLGVAVDKVGHTCLDIRNGALVAGQRIQFVTTDAPQTTGEAEILRKVAEACTPTDQNKPGLYHYEFKVIRGSLRKSFPAFALASFSGTLASAETGVTGDLDGDGHPESFRSCTSSEGVHLTVWKGKPLKGRREWHYYYYLGYDVDPTCTRLDTKPGS
jgi:hypothetical protein